MLNDSPDNAPIGPPAQGKSINALVLNCMIPGVGSLYRGQTAVGAAQLGLAVIGVFLIPLLLIGIPLIVAAYGWSIYSGVVQIRS